MISSKKGSTLELLGRMRGYRPRNRKELGAYVEAFLGLRIPAKRVCEDHDSPLDYLAYSFLGTGNGGAKPHSTNSFLGQNVNGAKICPRKRRHGTGQDGDEAKTCPRRRGHGTGSAGLIKKARLVEEGGRRNRDCVVWANRGGGKTRLGATASLLECVFLPHCQIRILGGSEEQSQRMYEYLRLALEGGFAARIEGNITARSCRFSNGAQVQVLAQSESSVRGHHVQRLRCDEAELFDRNVWGAVQFITHSRRDMPAQLEVLSTMHRPYGLMQEIIGSARENGMRVFRWCLWEVIERCRDRNCSTCCLWRDCRGKAKQAVGYYPIDDAIAQKRRSSAATWEAEMLCQKPNREDVVFDEFNPVRHVREISYNRNLPLYRTIDFGFSNPLVCLFIQVENNEIVYVIDEHIKSRTTLAEHARLIKERYPYQVEATYCDPAGRGRNEITGTNAITELAALGIPTRCRTSHIIDGIDLIRNFLSPAYGPPKLYVSARCELLIRAFKGLHYQRLANGALSELPEKDGVHDHLIDALRYFFVNRFGRKYPLREKKY